MDADNYIPCEEAHDPQWWDHIARRLYEGVVDHAGAWGAEDLGLYMAGGYYFCPIEAVARLLDFHLMLAKCPNAILCTRYMLAALEVDWEARCAFKVAWNMVLREMGRLQP